MLPFFAYLYDFEINQTSQKFGFHVLSEAKQNTYVRYK